MAAVLIIGLLSESFKGGSASPLILLNGVYIGRYSVLSDSRRIFVLCVLVWRTRDIAEVAMLCDLDEKVSVILERRGRSVGRQALMTAQDISIMVQMFESTNVPDCVLSAFVCLVTDRFLLFLLEQEVGQYLHVTSVGLASNNVLILYKPENEVLHRMSTY